MNETVQIRYTVPVTVTVDMIRECVMYVVVEDEAVTLDSVSVADTPRGNEAAQIAETAPWPEWNVG